MTAPLLKAVTSRAVHLARLELATQRVAPLIWAATAPALLRWLRATLRRVLPMLELRVMPSNPDAARLAAIIGSGLPPAPAGLGTAMLGMIDDIALEHGFLPRDPRGQALKNELLGYLSSDAGSYWRNLTDPQALANRITAARESGQSGAQIQRALESDYRANQWSAERLVRTTYTAGANLAQYQALKAQGYTELQWLTARDGRVRRGGGRSRFDHVRMEGVIKPIDVPFTTPGGSRMRFPGDRSLGATTGDLANCRCTIIGVRRAAAQPPASQVAPAPRRTRKPRAAPVATPEPVVVATSPVPLGTPVGNALTVTMKTGARQVKAAISAIDGWHGDGALPGIDIASKMRQRSNLGEYVHRTSTGQPIGINIKASGTHRAMTTAHEIGHYLDHHGMGIPGRFSSETDAVLADWRSAIDGSRAVKDLGAMPSSRYVAYLLQRRELFARSYAQYIATRTNDPALLLELNSMRSTAAQPGYLPIQWDDADFMAIADAFDRLMLTLNWRR